MMLRAHTGPPSDTRSHNRETPSVALLGSSARDLNCSFLEETLECDCALLLAAQDKGQGVRQESL